MKNEFYIVLFFLISFTIEHNITILDINNPICDEVVGVTTFKIAAETDLPIDKEKYNEPFLFSIIDDNNITYYVNCLLSGDLNATEMDTEYISETSYPIFDSSTDDSDGYDTDDYPDDASDTDYTRRIRLLNETEDILNGTCRIENIENNFIFDNNTIITSLNHKISYIGQNISLSPCSNDKTTDFEATLFISFRQINFFRQDDDNTVKFNFYGIITNNLPKDYLIIIEVYLIKNGFQDNKKYKALCYLTENIDGSKKPTQGEFNCHVYDVPEKVDSLIYYSSKSVASVPSDKGLLDPAITDKKLREVNYQMQIPLII